MRIHGRENRDTDSTSAVNRVSPLPEQGLRKREISSDQLSNSVTMKTTHTGHSIQHTEHTQDETNQMKSKQNKTK